MLAWHVPPPRLAQSIGPRHAGAWSLDYKRPQSGACTYRQQRYLAKKLVAYGKRCE